MSKKRGTHHNGRTDRKGKAYTPRHNDRDYEDTYQVLENSDLNWYYSAGTGKFYRHEDYKSKFPSFSEREEQIYKERYYHQYEEQQNKYKERRQYKRMKTFDEWRKSERYCPEETYLQVGNVKDGSIDSVLFKKAAGKYMAFITKWSNEHGQPFVVLDAAIHNDEAVPQMHIRKVWQHKNEDDEWVIGQEEALEALGFELPDPSKKKGRYNNRKMVFDAMCREKWLDICEDLGIEMERIPVQGAKHNRNKEEWLADELAERAKQLDEREARIKLQENRLRVRESRLDEREIAIEKRETEQQELIALGRREKASQMLENAPRMHERSVPWDFSFDE